VRTFGTTTGSLLELGDWLVAQGVSLCVMEAASTYWKPPFYLLEDITGCWVVNARDVKNVPGRAKTDKLDAVWLCKLAERDMLEALIAGQRDPCVLARMARGSVRKKISVLQEALTGHSATTTATCCR
jgi:hypothetical protein